MTEPAVTTFPGEESGFQALYDELKASWDSDCTRDAQWRLEQLAALERMMSEREQEIMDALAHDLGKPPQEAWISEISYVASTASYCRRNLRRWMKRRRVRTPLIGQPGRSWVQPEPLGVILIIGPWNYPLQLVLSGLAAAIAAGNCAILKPSELAPATSALLARLVPDYLDSRCIRVVEGGIPETTALLELPFDHILYTGNGAVGRIVMAAAAKNLTPVTLELGGKSPCVVLPDADLEIAARRIAWGKFTNAGQTCIAPDYVLTDEETQSQLVPMLAGAITDMFGSDPAASKSYGRIVNHRHFDRLLGLIDSGTLASGGSSDRDALYIEPTVLTDVAADSAAMEEEIFGPILPILHVESLDDAIRFVRKGDKPLAAYIFTANAASQERFLDKVSSGSACVNDTMMFMTVDELPFGGVGESGMGAYSGEHGFRTFSHMKAVMKRSWRPDLAMRYAPFTDGKFNLLRKLR
jgi:aldehyde dehydrogenase (NAD+)